MGIFKRSFADISNAVSVGGIRGGFNSMAMGITQQDIANINEYNRLVGVEGVSSQTAWNRTMLTSSSTAQGLFDNQENLVRSGHGLVLSQEAISNATQKMTVKMKLAEVGMKALSIAGNMLLFMGISMAISGVIKGIDYLIHREEKLQEALDESISALESTTSEIENLEEQVKTCAERIAELQKLKDAGTISLADEEELNNLKEENKELERQIALLQDKQIREGKQVLKDAKKQEDDKVQSRYKLGHKVTPAQELHGAVQGFIYAQNTDNDALADEHGARVEDMYEKIQPTLEAYRALEEAGYDLSDAEEEHYAQLKKAEDEYLLYTHLLNGTKESFVALSEEMQKQVLIRDLFYKKGMTQEQATAVVENIKPEDYVKMWESDFEFTPPDPNDYDSAEEYGKAYADAWIKGAQEGVEENANKMTVSLSDLEGASDKIKTLGSAFKELSDEGYITTKTLGEIKTATGLADDEWKSYETTLLNAKRGSSEFNQAMSELTYKTLENSIGTDKLANASESYIASVLRENGVTNANAVAHDVATKAKAEQHVQNQKVASSTEIDTKKLMENAIAAGIDEAAYRSLLAQEILFNNNNLDSKQKCEEILNIASAAGVATVQMSALNSEIAKVAGQKLGSGARTEYAEGLGGTVVHEKDRGKDGKGKGNLYISSDGKEFENFEDYSYYQTAYNQNKLISSAYDSTLTMPNYSGATSGSGSTKNEALDNYLKDAENRYKIHQDETKYIEELQHAHDNLTKDEKERLDIIGKINEAYRDLADNRIKDLEHQIDLKKEAYGEDYDATAEWNDIQRIAHEEAERLRKMGYDDNSNEIQELQKTWWGAQNNKLDWRLNNSKNWIEERNRLNDWRLFDDNEVDAWERVVKWLKEEYPHAVDEIKEAEENLFEARQNQLEDTVSQIERHIDKIKEAKQDEIEMEEALLSIREKNYETLNKLAEAQHEADKAIRTSRISYQYLDDDMIDQIYNEDDYKRVSEKIAEVGDAVDTLTNDFLEDINQAYAQDNLYLVESITAEYERQCALKERELEILQAEIDLQKKQEQLNNVLAEKNVRLLKDGKWIWTHDADNARQAMEELADAQYEYERQQKEHQQQLTLDSQQRLIDGLTSEVSMLDSQVEKLNDVVENITDPLTDFSTLIDSIVSYGNKVLTDAIGDVHVGASSVGGSKYSSNNPAVKGSPGYYNSNPNYDYTNAIANAKTEAEVRQLNNERNNKIDQNGLSYNKMSQDEAVDYWKSKRGYASGTKHALPGVADFNEGNKLEGLITNDGTLIPMANFAGGEMVFSHEMMENLWHHAQIPWNIQMPNIPSFELRTPQTIDGGQSFYGDINVYNPTDWNDFMRQLNAQTKSQNAITNRM